MRHPLSYLPASLKDRLKQAELRIWQNRLGIPPDTAYQWRGTAAPGEPDLRVLRYGVCEFRSMPNAHTLSSGVGYPRTLADHLAAEHGMTMEYSDVYSPRFETLPTTSEELRRFVKLTGEPDVVLVQIGGQYSYRTILGHGPRRALLRERFALSLGRHAHTAYRFANPVFRRFGRVETHYPGADRLGPFLDLVRREWPEADVLAISLNPLFADGAYSRAVQDRVHDDAMAVAEQAGVERLDLYDIVPQDARAYCANGANFGPGASKAVGDAIYRWLASRDVLAHRARRLAAA